MTLQRLSHLVQISTFIVASTVGLASCESPTGIRYTAADPVAPVARSVGVPQNCYLIDGQIYCDGPAAVPRDSAGGVP